jgi:UDP-N-acetyl-2-amino-2-deoxyglucuronate dehydrogenase
MIYSPPDAGPPAKDLLGINRGRPTGMATYIGLTGGGNISETHARAVREIPGAELAAIYGTNADKVGRLCREYGGKSYQDFDAFLAHRPMNLIVIGSPSGLHAEQGIAATQRGLHVLTEKPIDASTKRADALIEAAERSGVKLGVIFQDRVQPEIRQLKEWIKQGLLGQALLVDARVKWYRPAGYYSDSRWRGASQPEGGGVLLNHAVHTIDLMLWLLGDIQRVQSRMQTKLHAIAGEDTAVAILEFANGALGVLQATTAAYPGYPRRLEISGTQGTVILEHDRIVAADLCHPEATIGPVRARDQNESASSPVVNDIRGHRAVIEDFLQAIERDGTPLCDGREGRRSVALIEAMDRASQNPTRSAEV